MEHSYFLLFLVLLIIFADRNKKRKIAAIINRRANRNQKEPLKMKSLAENFIGKECMIYTITTSSIEPIKGIITEISDSGLLLNSRGVLRAVNLEYVTQIWECSKNKKGKK